MKGWAALAACLALVPATVSAKDPPFTDVSNAGLHGSIMRVRGGDRDGDVEAVGFDTTHIGFGYEAPFTVRVVNTARFALGSKGIEGGIGNELSGGVQVHGAFARIGIDATFFGNKYLWDSRFELPQVHLGWQRLVLGSIAEVAAKGGYVLLGRHNTGDADSLDLGGSPEVGGIAALHLGPVDLRASYARIFVRGENRPVDLFEGAFCGRPRWLQLCTDVRYEYGDTRRPSGAFEGVKITYVGFLLGLPERPKKN